VRRCRLRGGYRSTNVDGVPDALHGLEREAFPVYIHSHTCGTCSGDTSRDKCKLGVALRVHRPNTSQNFAILRSCSHVVRFIDSPPDGGRKPDNSCAT
jgi:hypothetical protein